MATLDASGRPEPAPVGREASLRLIADALPALIAYVDAGERYRYNNQAYHGWFGRAPADLRGRHARDVLGDAVYTAIRPHVEQALRGHAVTFETTLEGGDGGSRDVQASFVPHVGPRGRVLGFFSLMQDVTARNQLESLRRQRAEDALRAQVERQRFLAEASTRLSASLDYEATLREVARLAVPVIADWCMICLVEPNGAFRGVEVAHADPAKAALASRIMARVFPVRSGASWGVSKVLESGRPDLTPEVTDAMLEGLANDAEHLELLRGLGMVSTMRVPLVARGRVLGVISLGMAESGRRYGAGDLALAEDLAGRAAIAVDNARLYQEAQAAVRAREAFLARASHELRTPLTSALGMVRLLPRAMAGVLGESPETLVAVADRNLAAMLALINNLLDASKLASGTDTLALEPRRVAEAVAASLEVVGAQARDKRVTLRQAVPADLVVAADPLKLEQVLVNLLANAVHFTPPAGEVAIEGESRGDTVLITVSDTGEGLAAEHLERVFEPFFQVADGRRRPRGTGLGLAICRQIVTLHGGRIWAESEGRGRGSRFVVCLPAARA